jgi:hypothetical protein
MSATLIDGEPIAATITAASLTSAAFTGWVLYAYLRDLHV